MPISTPEEAKVHPAELLESVGFPDEDYMGDGEGLPENHYYLDLRQYGSGDFERLWAEEQAILDYVEGGGDLRSDEADDELLDNEVWRLNLDPGVASTVFALCAIGAVPVTSCNGWPGHFETHPLVLCWCSAEQLAVIWRAAQVAGVEVSGLSPPAILIWHAGDIEPMREFARALVGR